MNGQKNMGSKFYKSEEQKGKLFEFMKDEEAPNYDKYQSNETRNKISNSMKGEKNHFFGRTHTEVSKKMMSEKKKGMTAWNKGMHWSDESKRRISIAHIGIYPSKETIVKRSLSLTGLKHKPMSDTARANISRAHIGINPTDETRAKMRKCTLNEAAFATVTERSAYWIGMFIADGNVSIKKGIPIIALHLQEHDRDHVDKKFRVFVNHHIN